MKRVNSRRPYLLIAKHIEEYGRVLLKVKDNVGFRYRIVTARSCKWSTRRDGDFEPSCFTFSNVPGRGGQSRILRDYAEILDAMWVSDHVMGRKIVGIWTGASFRKRLK